MARQSVNWSATKDVYEGRRGRCIQCGSKFDIINRGDVICDDCEWYAWLAEEDRKKRQRKLKKVI